MAQAQSLRRFRPIYAACAVAILAVPLVSMQFTAEVDWSAGDVVVFASMLLALGAAIEVIVRYARNRWLRAIALALSVVTFFFIWAMLATG